MLYPNTQALVDAYAVRCRNLSIQPKLTGAQLTDLFNDMDYQLQCRYTETKLMPYWEAVLNV